MLLLGTLLPWLACCLLLLTLQEPGRPGSLALSAGLGGLVALLAEALFVYLWGVAGGHFNAAWMLSVFALLLALMLYTRRFPLGAGLRRLRNIQPIRLLPLRPSQWAALALLCLIALHVAPLLTEVFYRPLYPFDALTAWATKAKVWSSVGHWVPFVDKALWLSDVPPDAFTDHRPDYPIFTPLLQLWSATLAGGWSVSLVNVPWLVFYLSALLLFYGAAVMLGSGTLTAMLFTLFLSSLPLLNTHVALAGYADLAMGSVFLGAFALLALWSRERRGWQLLAFLLLVFCCVLIKNEGLFWAAALLVGPLLARLPLRFALLALAAGALSVPLLIWILPADLYIAGHTLRELEIAFYPEALVPLLQSLYATDSWNLTYCLLLLCVLPWGSMSPLQRRSLWPLLIVLLVSHGLLAALFLTTGYYRGAILLTAVSRINMALVPSVLLFVALSFASLRARREPEHASAG